MLYIVIEILGMHITLMNYAKGINCNITMVTKCDFYALYVMYVMHRAELLQNELLNLF
jgi:hypothetical protein